MSNATNSNANISKSKNISSVFCCLSGICIKFRMLWKKIPASEIISFWNYRLQKAGLLKSVKIPLSEHFFFFSIRVLFHRDWRLTGLEGKGGDHLLFHSTTSTSSRTFRHLFATLYVRWLSHIFNRIVCIYQAATRWDLPPYRITIWLTNDVTLSFCLFTWWFDSSFSLLRQSETGNRWIWTRIDYHSCITSEPTNQVC